MEKDNIVISGIGAYTPYGYGFDVVWDNICNNISAFTKVGDIAPDSSECLAGVIHDFSDIREILPFLKPPLPIPETQFLLAAAKSALDDSKLQLNTDDNNIGVFLERFTGPSWAVSELMLPVLRDGAINTSPLLFSQSVANAPLGEVARRYKLLGPNLLLMNSGSITIAKEFLMSHMCEAIVCCGVNKIDNFNLLSMRKNKKINGLSEPDLISPYNSESLNTVLGEGAVALVLELESTARKRDATIYSKIIDSASMVGGSLDDSNSLVGWGNPDIDTLTRLSRNMIIDNDINLNDINLFVGGGNACPILDDAEKKMLINIGLSGLELNSVKGYLGECLGMSSLISIAFASVCIKNGLIPNTNSLSKNRKINKALITNIDYHLNYFSSLIGAVET